jgi:hypothetical protein
VGSSLHGKQYEGGETSEQKWINSVVDLEAAFLLDKKTGSWQSRHAEIWIWVSLGK